MRLDEIATSKLVAWMVVVTVLAFLFVLTAFPATSIGN